MTTRLTIALGLVLALHPLAAGGQMSSEEANQRLQERAAARAKMTAAPTSQPAAATALSVAESRPAADPDSALLKARVGFHTTLRPDAVNPQDDHGQTPDAPPKGIAKLIKYSSPLGRMWAYVSPNPGDGKRHPAVVWIHGGSGGLDSGLFSRDEPADNDQTPTAFLDAHLVVMCPSFRGQNDNPGKWEMFYGEVDDAVAAIDYLAKLPYVDPARIYVVGHSTGGTMTLLAAEASGKVRAAFSLCGCPDVQALVSDTTDHHHAPFDYTNPKEGELRSAVHFVDHLHTPTWFFDQSDSFYVSGAEQMSLSAGAAHAPFTAMFLTPATHYDVVRPLTQLIAAKLATDTGPGCNVTISSGEISAVFGKVFAGRTEQVDVAPTQPLPLRVTPLARQLLQLVCTQNNLDAAKAVICVTSESGQNKVSYFATVPNGSYLVQPVDGVTVALETSLVSHLGPATIAVGMPHGSLTWVLLSGVDTPAAEPNVVITPLGAMPGSPQH